MSLNVREKFEQVENYIAALEAKAQLGGSILASILVNLQRGEFDEMPAIKGWRAMVDDWVAKGNLLEDELRKAEGKNDE